MDKETHVIVLGGIKGGVGKSTLAVNIAVELAKKSEVLIIDSNVVQYSSASFLGHRNTSDKNSSLAFIKGRVNNTIKCKVVETPDIFEEIQNNEDTYGQYDYIILDSGGTIDSYMRSAILAASYGILLLPTQPSIFDIWGLQDTLKMLEDARKVVDIKAYALINMVMPYNTMLITDTLEALADFQKDYNIGIFTSTVGNRLDFKKATALGQGVVEYAPRNKAAKEIRALAREIKKALKK